MFLEEEDKKKNDLENDDDVIYELDELDDLGDLSDFEILEEEEQEDDFELPMDEIDDLEDYNELEDFEEDSDDDFELPMEADDLEGLQEDENLKELDEEDENIEIPMEEIDDLEDLEDYDELGDFEDGEEEIGLPMQENDELEDLQDYGNPEEWQEDDEEIEIPMEEMDDLEELEAYDELSDFKDSEDDFEFSMEENDELEDLQDYGNPEEWQEDDEEMDNSEDYEELEDWEDSEDDMESSTESDEDLEDFVEEETTEENQLEDIEYYENDDEMEEVADFEEEESQTEETDETDEETDESIEQEELAQLTSLRAEYVFLGLLLNNPKAISRYYFLYEDCHFANQELDNMYRIILFREAEQYAPAIAKEGFKLPLEANDTYNLQVQLQEVANERNYDIEMVYTILKKLFILKKHYLLAPTKMIRDSILDIVNYKLYNEMTVEEVESAIEQIGVTAGLSQGRLTDDATSFLLNEENSLVTGADLPFPILSSVFKGIRKGETFVYAMPSNSGKSRFTINIASYLAFTQNKKVLIISNEMSEEKMKLCLITTILNNKAYQKLHGQDISKSEGELLGLKFRPDKKKGIKLDENGYILREDNEPMQDFVERLNELSSEFRKTIATTEWLNEQIENSIYFIHITEHTNEDIRKIIMNYYYREDIEYIFYDTLKADTENIGDGNEVKKTATILSNLAQKFEIFIGSSMQLLESSTLPVNLTINDMSASRTVKEVLDTLCLMKQINPQTLAKYEYSPVEEAKEYQDLEVFEDPNVRYYVCVVDKNRAGAKPKLLFRLNLAYNFWEELGYVRLKQEFIEME